MKQNLGLEKRTNDTSFEYTVEEPYTQNTIGKYGNNKTILYTLIPDFTTYTRAKANSWALKNGFTIEYEEVETTKYADGKIYKQSYPEKKRIDLCTNKTITLTIAVNKPTVTPPPTNDDTTNNDNTTDNTNESTNTPETNTGNTNE
jgi:beta-lactam-binding protein with PASTA domain